MLLGASAVLLGGLDGQTSLGASLVEVAAVVHGQLQRVVLPAEDVITVGGGATAVHAVDEGVAAVRGEDALVHEGRRVPHELVHDLGQLDGVAGRASTTAGSTITAVGDVALVVGAVEVLTIPAAKEAICVSHAVR